jgi:putative ABC transport system ATP-binding protein
MLSVRNLQRTGLHAASFDVADGECVAVRGPSGSGKTLLLRAIADLDPNDGTVMLDGRNRADMPAPQWRRLVAYVPAEPGWWAETLGAHFAEWSAAAPLVADFGLPRVPPETPVQRLSTGERQRFALIRALQLNPRMLLLDEPTASLDPDGVAAVEAEIRKRRDAGTGVVWVTHDAGQADRVASRRIAIEHGQVREVAP